MTGFLSRWAVQRDHAVDGVVTDEALSRWVDDACAAYLDLCRSVRSYTVRREVLSPPVTTAFGTPTGVVATASATEVRPGAFTLSVRLRPHGGDVESPVNVTCVVELLDPGSGEVLPVPDAVRDELIAIEHDARHFN